MARLACMPFMRLKGRKSMNDVATLILAVVAMLGLVAAVVRWFYARGGEERELTVAVRENTAVTKQLSVGLVELKEFTVGQVHKLSLDQERLSHEVASLKTRVEERG